MKKKLVLLTIFILNNLSAEIFKVDKAIETAAAEWTERAVRTLNSDEQIVVANFLYFNYLAASSEKNVNELLLTISNQHVTLNNQLPNLAELLKANEAQIQNSMKLSSLITPTITALNLLEHTNALLQKINSLEINRLLEEFESFCHTRMTCYIEENSQHTEKNLKEANQELGMCIKNLALYSATLQAIASRKDNYLQENVNEHVAMVDAMLAVTDKSAQGGHTINTIINRIKKMSVELLDLNSKLSLTFYQHLYKNLQKRKIKVTQLVGNKNDSHIYAVSVPTLPYV